MQWLKSLLGLRDDRTDIFSPVPPNPAQDALAAIDELSRAIRHHDGAIEVCSALGNLYRLRGQLDRAIQMRSSLLTRADLSREDQIRIHFELGRDYARAGILDRAQEAFNRCREIGGHTSELDLELALLYAKSGDFLAASRQYNRMGHPLQAAHYLVRAATGKDGRTDTGLLAEALELYPGSPEAWLETIMVHITADDWPGVLDVLEPGLRAVEPQLGFALLHPLMDPGMDGAPNSAVLPEDHLERFVDIMRRQPQNLALLHVTGCLLRAHGRQKEAATWQEKALLLRTDFWPARLELLAMSMPDQTMTEMFAMQLDFLLRRAREVRRFVCRRCGLRRSQIFFCCPKCLSWHSISYRHHLNDGNA